MPHTSISRFGLILAAALVLLAGLITLAVYQTRPQPQPAADELDKPVMPRRSNFWPRPCGKAPRALPRIRRR